MLRKTMGLKYPPVLLRIQAANNTPVLGRGVALVLVSAVSFGIMPILAKLAYAERVNLITLLTMRFCLAALVMWALWASRRHEATPAHLTATRLLPLIAMGGLYVGQSFSYFRAVGIISASATGLLLYTYPVLVTVLAWLFFREALTRRKLAALFLATIGTLLVLGLFSLVGGQNNQLGTLDPRGVGWALAASGIYSAYIIAGTRFTRGLPALFCSAVVITSAAVVYAFWGLATGQLDFSFGWLGWVWAVAIALVSTVLAIATFFAGLAIIGPSRAAIVSTVEPAVTVGLGTLVLGEILSIEQACGAVLILAAVFVLQIKAPSATALAE
jgi:drug/metabolite transporter (DMT)-like permease